MTRAVAPILFIEPVAERGGAEAVLLSLFGGVVGVAVGLIGSRFTIVGVEPVVAPYSVVLAFAVAILIGLFFGLYPAVRASNLDPINALRYE